MTRKLAQHKSVCTKGVYLSHLDIGVVSGLVLIVIDSQIKAASCGVLLNESLGGWIASDIEDFVGLFDVRKRFEGNVLDTRYSGSRNGQEPVLGLAAGDAAIAKSMRVVVSYSQLEVVSEERDWGCPLYIHENRSASSH